MRVPLAFGCVVVACGDNARPCDYDETDDVANASTAEPTALSVDGPGLHVCGALDSGHYDPLLGAIDDDAYRITVTTPSPVLVQIFGEDGVELLGDIVVRFFDTAANPRLVGQGRFDPALAGHGAFVIALAPGVYDMRVTARATGDLSAPLPYRIRLSAMPACDAITSPVDYTEAHDGDTGTGNDAVDVDFSRDPSFTPTPVSTPEPTGLEIGAGEHYLVAGDAGAGPHADEYADRDTYELATGDATNELAIRLDWDGDAADLDYIVFEAGATTPVVTSNLASTTTRELAMFAVRPRTTYWLWVGGFRGSAATAYRATVCGSHFYY
jgi:hypothetical protein